jgi:hypothetical protein
MLVLTGATRRGGGMSRELVTLKSWFQPKVHEFVKRTDAAGLPVLITRTFTSGYTQGLLYKVGREELTNAEIRHLTNEGVWAGRQDRIVTNAKEHFKTPHGLGLAFDCVPYKVQLGQRKLWWKAPDSVWVKLYDIGEDCGLDALGDEWGEYVKWDKGHFQEPGWKIYADVYC